MKRTTTTKRSTKAHAVNTHEPKRRPVESMRGQADDHRAEIDAKTRELREHSDT